MTKKILSLVLSLVLVVGLIPSMSVFAEEENAAVTVLYDEDFADFDVATYNGDYTASANTYYLKDNYGTTRFGVGTFFKSDIVNMPGYDGKPTNALKLTLNPDAAFTSTHGSGRLELTGLKTPVGEVTDGALIYQLKMYIPEADSAGNRKDINSFAMSPIVKGGDSYGVGTSSIDTSKRYWIDYANPGEWLDLTYVMLMDESLVLVYCNGKLVSYKEETVSAGGYRFQFQRRRAVEDEHIIFDDFKVWHIAGKSAEDLSPQCITTASSRFADSTNVAITANPTVDFSEMILNRDTEGALEKVLTSSAEMEAADGTPVELTDVTVGSDKKSVIINPAEALTPGATYNVKVTGIYDMYGELIPDYEFSFTTAESISVELNAAPSFKKANIFSNTLGNELTALENGYVNVNYGIKNTSATKTYSAVLLTVLRDGGDVKYFQFETGTVAPGGELTFDGSFMVDDAENQTIETYVWDSFYGVNALTEKYVIDTNGITNVAIENQ